MQTNVACLFLLMNARRLFLSFSSFLVAVAVVARPGEDRKNLSPCSSLASVRHPSVFDYTRALSSRERATAKEQPVKERKAKKESSSKLAATSTTIIQKRK
jgi:hypothetical protein